MPKKLDDCVDKVKDKPSIENPWAVCNAKLGKETKEDHNPWDIPFGYEADKKTQEKINANRQVPVFNPPIKKGSNKPDNQKNKKGIGGQVGKIDSTENPMNPTLWKEIFDSQLRRNVKEPRY